jgi:hypothetical protein
MSQTDAVEKRRQRIIAICEGLPEVTSRIQAHIKFEVRGKTVAYYLNDHHGDGRVAINIKVPAGQQQALIAAYPDRFFYPAYLGAKGWLGLYVDLKRIDWDEVTDLITESYRLTAPKRLAALI